MARTLRDNGVDAYCPHSSVYSLVECPTFDGREKHLKYRMRSRREDESILSCSLEDLSNLTGRQVQLMHNYIPVRYHDLADVPSVDVAICSQSGRFSKYRNWPYFDELKAIFRKAGITYVDLTDLVAARGREASMACLNYVKKSKLYLGLETGTSHFVSQFANGNSLILQSGFCRFSWWCFYDYDHIEVDVDCKGCWLPSTEDCPYGHRCMREISVERVYGEVAKRINQ